MILKRIWTLVMALAIAASFLLGGCGNLPLPKAELPIVLVTEGNLPLDDAEFDGTINETYVDSTADPDVLESPAQPPPDAPNVVLVMLDDVGFGAAETFGGPIHTPTLNQLADHGLSYNRFHTTAMCSPTRAALLTGRNHHSAASAVIAEMSTGFPGYTGLIPQSTATVAQILQGHGYSTAWLGKNHNLPVSEGTNVGPFSRWPNDLGFDYFYGFINSDTDQWYPNLYENRNPINQPAYPDKDNLDDSYNLTRDLADKAISWVRYNHSLSPDKPFFLYFVPGATHAPHQPPPSYTEKYQAGGEHAIEAEADEGMFVEGWDVLQESICETQKEMGIIPDEATCTQRPDQIPAWNDEQFDYADGPRKDKYRELMSLQMQTFAGYLEYTDEQVGRVIDAIDQLGELENTLIIYIVGDNGASAEGGFLGTCNEIANVGGYPFTQDENLACQNGEGWGAPGTDPHYAVGWAWATDAPFRWTKQVASYFGGTRNPMVISWPGHIENAGNREADLRDQFLHVIDVAPTILDVVGIEPPDSFNGIAQKPMDGASFANTFGPGGAIQSAPRDTQYFEMVAHRGIYHDGWMASSFHREPWITTGSSLEEDPDQTDEWELFNLEEDFSQNDNVAADNPAKLKRMKELFADEAEKYNVFPLDDRFSERFSEPRPTVLAGRTDFEFYPGATFLPATSSPDIGLTSYVITADLKITDADNVKGVILANGGDTGGYSLYVNEDRDLVFEYNYFDKEHTQIVHPSLLWANDEDVQVQFEFDYDKPRGCLCPIEGVSQADIDAGALPFGGCGGTGSLSYSLDEETQIPSVSGRIEITAPSLSGLDTQDVGMDLRTPVSDAYTPPFAFTGGEIKKVTIDINSKRERMPEDPSQCLL